MRPSSIKPHIIKTETRSKRCYYCAYNNKHTLTFFTCTVCVDSFNFNIGLCSDPCFKLWHKSYSSEDGDDLLDIEPIPATTSSLKLQAKLETFLPFSMRKGIFLMECDKQNNLCLAGHMFTKVDRPRSRGFCVECIKKNNDPDYRKTVSQIQTYCVDCISNNWICELCFKDLHESII